MSGQVQQEIQPKLNECEGGGETRRPRRETTLLCESHEDVEFFSEWDLHHRHFEKR